MQWIEVKISTSPEAVEAMSYFLQEVLQAKGVAMEEDEKWGTVEVNGYFPEWTSTQTLQEKLVSHLDQLQSWGLDPGAGTIQFRWIDEQSWENEWKQYFKPIRITDRLTVKPLWEEYTPTSPSEKIIEMEPGMAFGTGTHPTTALCLRAIEAYLQVGDRVMDIGCGSGILSIAAAKLGAGQVRAVDSDPVAIRVARKNCLENQVQDTVQVQEGDLLKGISETAELIVANILAEVICQFTHEVPRVLTPGGLFVASGIISEKREMVEQSMTEMGLSLVDVLQEGNWVAMVAKKW